MRKTIDINFIKDQNYLMISEFNIAVSDDEIDLLKHKIEITRWPDEINNKWSHGTDLNFLKSFCHTWQNDFDWRKHENKINETGSFRFTSNSGLKIHFLHSKSNPDTRITYFQPLINNLDEEFPDISNPQTIYPRSLISSSNNDFIFSLISIILY